MKDAYLVLDSGDCISAKNISVEKEVSGELVFTTGMVGYAETLTDPSYYGQIIVFTYPMIGNYGVPSASENYVEDFFESKKVHASACVISVNYQDDSHYQSISNLGAWLKKQGVPCLVDVDTRRLTQMITSKKKILGGVSASPSFQDDFLDIENTPVASKVTCLQATTLGTGKLKIGVLDCGIKHGILREILKHDVEVEIFPANHPVQDNKDGWIISNGPGNPAREVEVAGQVEKIISYNKNILGICLGSQLIAIACGAQSKRLPYGHRSHNQPVLDLLTNRCYITSQNHGYEVDFETMGSNFTKWFVNLNDDSLEGFKSVSDKIWGIQFHPEASPGPEDCNWILEQFFQRVSKNEK